jgi:tetratricopeptide (TPR) repeat protein
MKPFSVAFTILLLPVALSLSGVGLTEAADEAEAISRLVQESQRAGFERHDFDKYMAIWSDDAKIILGRSEKPDAHDTTYTRAQIAATRRTRFRADASKDFKLTFANVRPEIDGDQATLKYRSTYRTAEIVETLDEVFRLRKKDGNWKVFENRAWPVETHYGDKVTRYNAETWKALDTEVKKQEERSDLARQVGALFDAWRFKDAHALARKWTEQMKDEPNAWLFRGSAAMIAGDATDALASFDKALALDPNAEVPDYVRAAKKNK